MKLDEIPPLMRRLKRGPLHTGGSMALAGRGRAYVETLLPHRDPFLFIDRIVSVDPETQTLLAERHVPADDPIFKGHFPDVPIFPAALQIEAIGQASLCLWRVLEGESVDKRAGLRVTKVEHALFTHPVLPGDVMQLHATLVYADDLVVSAAGQVFVDDTLAAALIIKVSIIDE